MSQDFGPYFRLIVCILLVCCLLISISPIQTKATAAAVATFTEIAVESVLPIAAIVCGLGVSQDPAKQAVFDTLVNNIVSHFNFAKTMQVVGWVANGCQRYAVPQSLIEDVRSYLWGQKVVHTELSSDYNVHFPAGTTFTTGYGTYVLNETSWGFAYYYRTYGYHLMFVTDSFESPSISLNGSPYTSNAGRTYISSLGWVGYNYIGINSSTLSDYNLGLLKESCWNDSDAILAFFSGSDVISPKSSIVVSPGLIPGEIADESTSFASGYASWAAGTVAVPGTVVGSDTDDEIAYVPVSIGQTYTETVSQTQEEVQTGDATYVDTSESATTGLLGTVIGWLEDIWTAIKSIPSAFSQWFTDIITWLHDIWDVISTLPKSIADAIAEVLTAIFVPTEDYLTEKVEAIRSEFAFADAIITTGEFFKTRFSGLGTEPPVIYINLGAAEGSYNLGGRIPFLDLSWYERYKSTGDVLISSFLWIVFAWRMLLKVPGIISGMPGDFVMQGMQEIGISDHLPSRKKEYEIQRQNNRNLIRRHKE